jgi:hypothetical protein
MVPNHFSQICKLALLEDALDSADYSIVLIYVCVVAVDTFSSLVDKNKEWFKATSSAEIFIIWFKYI